MIPLPKLTYLQIKFAQQHMQPKEDFFITFKVEDSASLLDVVHHNSVDYVIDIENTLFYPNVSHYFQQVNQALKEDGTFFFADFVPASTANKLEKRLKKYFDVVKKEDITANIL